MAAPSKQYGLIFPKKAQQKTLVKHAVFMDDSDEESSVGESLQREALKKQAMKQTKLEIQRALAEDSTVYEYDNIYDDIQQKKAESQASILAGKGEKKPKYIQNILKAAELRKKEQERRMEKKIQKEREMEGDAFDDKEAFVTSAYKKKLQERAEEEEREKKEAALEAVLDVTKQKDLSGFYRHLLNQTVGEEETPKCSLREARLKEDPSSEHPRNTGESRNGGTGPAKGEDNPDADSDLEIDTSEDEKVEKVDRREERKESRKGHSGGERSKHRKRSSSEEGSRSSKALAGHRDKEGEARKERRGSEKKLRPDNHEREDRQRSKDRKERDDYHREMKKEKDREDKYSEWEQQEKDRETSGKDHREKRDGHQGAKEGREEKQQQKESNSRSPGLSVPEERSAGRGKESPPHSERPPEMRRKASGEGEEQEEKLPEQQSKFAKRSNQETVTSARDRYLARQMARMGAKAYIEKEED
ncbi:nuclear speckle splicing regulatory protein 1 [Anolis sagrei]|uniref:nuclear speckle splicing regulatory protein 1 n=1 Tax=Anolis sagrei TaxID=38937 RepID=UPI003521A5F0